MTTYTVRLENDTVGTLTGQNPEDLINEVVTVQLHDENGNPIEVRGKLVEILETREDWE